MQLCCSAYGPVQLTSGQDVQRVWNVEQGHSLEQQQTIAPEQLIRSGLQCTCVRCRNVQHISRGHQLPQWRILAAVVHKRSCTQQLLPCIMQEVQQVARPAVPAHGTAGRARTWWSR
jgi:hypothetical protein